ncbi:hypothetical protein IWQ57_000096 [Coemansia nantahalensis]|uniref:Uncharacterized protein n=2 Tax=Coemansia TaxID=4863 RepID=A0ACC1L7D9_9FUNG|nr:hypothetical protein IWQ57_000096 [Coemansia nantahalensis]KAJ2801999.1 hypothetical protein H4R21_002594 [Coemansia helicoidea]
MKPDPYKQKASRRYQAAHGGAPKSSPLPEAPPALPTAPAPPALPTAPAPPAAPAADSRKYARRRIQDNSWRFDGGTSAPQDAAAAAEQEVREEEENIQEFLRYLKDEAQSTAAEHSAAYFQLRTEAASTGLGAPNEDTWGRLVEVDWSSLLDMASAMPLHELLGLDSDSDTAPPPRVPSDTQPPPPPPPKDNRQPSASAVARTLDAAELAPGVGTRGRAAVPVQPRPQPAPSVDAMEAFLDNLL